MTIKELKAQALDTLVGISVDDPSYSEPMIRLSDAKVFMANNMVAAYILGTHTGWRQPMILDSEEIKD